MKIIIDCASIYYLYALSSDSFELETKDGTPIEVVYKFLDAMTSLYDLFPKGDFVFCFEGGKSARKNIYPEYKAHRTEATDEIKRKRERLYPQIPILQSFLSNVGFANVISVPGYEADDVVASITQNNLNREPYIIVTNDSDLYQLISIATKIYLFRKARLYDFGKYVDEFDGLLPENHYKLKAMAGDASDNIKGIPSCGEKSAIKFFKKTLGKNTKVYKTIKDNKAIYDFNIRLVKLPFEGTPQIKIAEDSLSMEKFKAECLKYEFQSLIENPKWHKIVNKARY